MADFIITNKTDKDITLPSPVSYVLKARASVNMTEQDHIGASDIRAIASFLNALEQQGQILVQGVADDVDAISAAAEGAGDIHPMVVKDAMAEEIAIQIPAWNGATGAINVAKTFKLCITDDGGSPSLLGTFQPSITVTASGSCKLNGTNSNVAVLQIVDGMVSFTALDTVAEAVNFVLTGSVPTNVVTGVPYMLLSPYTVTFS